MLGDYRAKTVRIYPYALFMCKRTDIFMIHYLMCFLSGELALLPQAKRGRRFQRSSSNLTDRAPSILEGRLHTDELCSTLCEWSGTILQMNYPMFQMNSNRIQY